MYIKIYIQSVHCCTIISTSEWWQWCYIHHICYFDELYLCNSKIHRGMIFSCIMSSLEYQEWKFSWLVKTLKKGSETVKLWLRSILHAVYFMREMTEWLHIRFNKTTSRSDAALVDETEIRARSRSWMLEIQAHVGLVRVLELYVLRSPGSTADSSRCAKSASLYPTRKYIRTYGCITVPRH